MTTQQQKATAPPVRYAPLPYHPTAGVTVGRYETGFDLTLLLVICVLIGGAVCCAILDAPFVWFVLGGIGLVSLVYWCALCACDQKTQSVFNQHSQQRVDAYINASRRAKPQIEVSCECYHYVTKTISSTDMNGRTTTRTHEEKVTTYRGSEPFVYQSSVDMSNRIEWAGSIARVATSFTWSAADEDTKAAYKALWDRMNANRNRDTHFSIWGSDTLEGADTVYLGFADPDNRPWWFSPLFYVPLMLFLPAFYVYRRFYDAHVCKIDYELVKYISIHQSNGVPYRRPVPAIPGPVHNADRLEIV